MGINITGVPVGKKWAKDIFVLCRNPKTTVPAHRGIAKPKFIESCVVVVNVWGRSPSKLLEAIKIINDVSKSVHERPFSECMSIICFEISLNNHSWNDSKRLLKRRVGLGKKIVGNKIIRITIGKPMSVGEVKEVNKFSFILNFKDKNI